MDGWTDIELALLYAAIKVEKTEIYDNDGMERPIGGYRRRIHRNREKGEVVMKGA